MYEAAGVSIQTGNQLVERIKPLAKQTMRPEVLASIGGFGALYELPLSRYRRPVLVSSTDGVGTKLKLAQYFNHHRTIGIDLVAMCVNDLIVCGAEPIFFLDYFATGHLELDQAEAVIAGIAEGCIQAGCALVGGETAEMPGLYQGSDYDLAGFSVGLVEKDQIIDGSKVVAGDICLGLASSGFHSNGFSLVRKILSDHNIDLSGEYSGRTWQDILLQPTIIYVRAIQQLLAQCPIHAIANITGGGIIENLPRVLPRHHKAVIHHHSFPVPDYMQHLKTLAQIPEDEFYRVFNAGIGMVVVLPQEMQARAQAILQGLNIDNWVIGTIEQHAENNPVVMMVE